MKTSELAAKCVIEESPFSKILFNGFLGPLAGLVAVCAPGYLVMCVFPGLTWGFLGVAAGMMAIAGSLSSVKSHWFAFECGCFFMILTMLVMFAVGACGYGALPVGDGLNSWADLAAALPAVSCLIFPAGTLIGTVNGRFT